VITCISCEKEESPVTSVPKVKEIRINTVFELEADVPNPMTGYLLHKEMKSDSAYLEEIGIGVYNFYAYEGKKDQVFELHGVSLDLSEQAPKRIFYRWYNVNWGTHELEVSRFNIQEIDTVSKTISGVFYGVGEFFSSHEYGEIREDMKFIARFKDVPY
jgi:hypothetical protein